MSQVALRCRIGRSARKCCGDRFRRDAELCRHWTAEIERHAAYRFRCLVDQKTRNGRTDRNRHPKLARSGAISSVKASAARRHLITVHPSRGRPFRRG